MRQTKATLIRFICFVFLTAVRCITAHNSRSSSRIVDDTRTTVTALVGGPCPRTAGLAFVCLLSLVPLRCATVLTRPVERIAVASIPDGAQVSLRCNGLVAPSGTTPSFIEVHRRAENCAVTLTKDGFEPATVPLGDGINRTYWGNLLLDGGVLYAVLGASLVSTPAAFFVGVGLAGSAPWFVDIIDGRKHEHNPKRISVVLHETSGSTAAGSQ